MSLARANAGVLRRLAGGPEASRYTASLQATAQSLHAQSPSPLQRTTPPLSSTSSPSPSRSSPFSLQASCFHTSAPRPARRRRFASVHAAKMGLIDDAAITKSAKENLPTFTASEKELLREKYTPAQMASIEASEAAIDPKDLTIQARLRRRTTEHGIGYFDDFSKLQPIIDRRPRDPVKAGNVAHAFTTMGDDAFTEDFDQWLRSFVADKNIEWDSLSLEERTQLAEKYGPSDLDIFKYLTERPAIVRPDGKTRVLPEELGNSALAPALPFEEPGKTTDLNREAIRINPYDEGLDESGDYERLMYRTGLKVSELMQLAVREVVVRMVSNQTRLGKIRSFSVIAIAGNGNGRLGLGHFKSTEYSTARSRAREMAILNMKPIPRYEDRTIYGNVECKISGTVVQLFSRPPGFGLRVPHRIFEMARAAGIQDLAAKIPRSRNPMNTVKATYQALMQQRDPEQIATGRGKKLVDVRKVYYGGAVY
ncbi:28S ribosomal protein S5, mitochondrial [Sporothrix eucalyptigena]|uniref:28S ribosomal protein S5, mitochondrial n=1 Tax=Sporothrix eucalyptigena TaxID=1812306 RepID=A0ABP0C4R9_9PEZI